jgi:hypothetical protein
VFESAAKRTSLLAAVVTGIQRQKLILNPIMKTSFSKNIAITFCAYPIFI